MTRGNRERGAPAGSSLRPGDVVAGYSIRAFLGRGGMSEVHEAYDPAARQVVAIKVLRCEHRRCATAVRRAGVEAEVLRRIDHPGIVRVLAAGSDGAHGLFYTVMERLRGVTLAERIGREGRLGVGETLALGASVADSLAVLHAMNIVHRDIKPENVFLTDEGRVVLMDLGVAELHGQALATGSTVSTVAASRSGGDVLIGTLEYMSPEQIHRMSPVDARADLYALGLVLFKCLTGYNPATGPLVGGEPRAARHHAAWHMLRIPPLVSDVRSEVPVAVAQLVARTLEKDRARRPESAAVLADELRCFLAELESRSWTTGLSSQVRLAGRLGGRPGWRGALGWIGAVGFGFACGVGVVMIPGVGATPVEDEEENEKVHAAPTSRGDAGVRAAAAPDGAIPDGAIPDGAIPDGAIPDARWLDATLPDATMPDAMPLGESPEQTPALDGRPLHGAAPRPPAPVLPEGAAESEPPPHRG